LFLAKKKNDDELGNLDLCVMVIFISNICPSVTIALAVKLKPQESTPTPAPPHTWLK
jgi:hypothetical protein